MLPTWLSPRWPVTPHSIVLQALGGCLLGYFLTNMMTLFILCSASNRFGYGVFACVYLPSLLAALLTWRRLPVVSIAVLLVLTALLVTYGFEGGTLEHGTGWSVGS